MKRRKQQEQEGAGIARACSFFLVFLTHLLIREAAQGPTHSGEGGKKCSRNHTKDKSARTPNTHIEHDTAKGSARYAQTDTTDRPPFPTLLRCLPHFPFPPTRLREEGIHGTRVLFFNLGRGDIPRGSVRQETTHTSTTHKKNAHTYRYSPCLQTFGTRQRREGGGEGGEGETKFPPPPQALVHLVYFWGTNAVSCVCVGVCEG